MRGDTLPREPIQKNPCHYKLITQELNIFQSSFLHCLLARVLAERSVTLQDLVSLRGQNVIQN